MPNWPLQTNQTFALFWFRDPGAKRKSQSSICKERYITSNCTVYLQCFFSFEYRKSCFVFPLAAEVAKEKPKSTPAKRGKAELAMWLCCFSLSPNSLPWLTHLKHLYLEPVALKAKPAPVLKGKKDINVYFTYIYFQAVDFFMLFILICHRGRSSTQKCLFGKGEGQGCATEER